MRVCVYARFLRSDPFVFRYVDTPYCYRTHLGVVLMVFVLGGFFVGNIKLISNNLSFFQPCVLFPNPILKDFRMQIFE